MESNKNAYEIRLSLLQLATEIVNTNTCTENQESQGHAGNLAKLKTFSAQDVIEEAKKLQAFVDGGPCKKSKQHNNTSVDYVWCLECQQNTFVRLGKYVEHYREGYSKLLCTNSNQPVPKDVKL